jgi:molecular chaperone DnaJ
VSKRDYYEVLGLARHAAESELKSAYRKLALQHHPDRNPGDKGAEERFKEAAEAYAVLSDPQKRAAYDRFGHAGVSGASGGIDPSTFVGFEDILGGLGDVFGLGDLFGGGRRRGGPQQGSHLRYDLEISFEEAARGAETSIQFPRAESCEVCRGSGAAAGSGPTACPTCGGRGQLRYQQGFFTVARTCSQCRGTGQIIAKPCAVCRGEGRVMKDRKLTVKIPAGIDTGQRLRIQGEGEHGVQNGPPGDLYVVVQVQDHAFFRREGNDLYCEMPLHFPTLALGGEIKVATLLGEPEPLKVPEGTATGSTFRLRGKGLPDVSGRGKGDLFVTVHATTPKKLTKEQRQLLESLAKSLPPEKFEPRRNGETHDDRNIFDRVKDIFG